MIKFTKVYLEGFGSYITRKKFKLDRPGLNIVIADNGSGKTTTFSGLVWALTGTSLKKTKNVSTWPKFRTKDYKGTYVEVCFNKGKDKYSVIRLKDYKGVVHGAKGKDRLILVKNGEPVKFGNKKDTEKGIFEVLGFTEELLLNSVVFGQRMKRLIENSGPEKKRVFEEAFSAGFLQLALTKAKEDLKDLQEELKPMELEYELTKERKQNLKELIQNEKENIERMAKQQEKAITFHKNQIKELKADIRETTIDFEDSDIYKIRDVIRELQSNKEYDVDRLSKVSNDFATQLSEVNQDIAVKKEQIKYLLKQNDHLQKSSKCEVCGSVLKDPKVVENHIKKHHKQINSLRAEVIILDAAVKASKETYEPKIEELKRNLDLFDQNIKEKNKLREKLVLRKHEHTQAIASNKKIEEHIKSAKKKIKQLEAEKIPGVNKEVKAKYKKAKLKLKELKPKVKSLLKDQENLKWVINDLLSNKGIKAFIFDKMLEKLNEKLRYYEQFIGFRVEFKVDLEGGNKDIYAICYLDNDLVFYEDLSGGEKQKVDAATAFALFDLVSYNRPTNLLVFDEPFEGLDEANTEVVSDLIADKAKDKSVFLISHNLQLQNSSTKVIRMSKGKDGDTIHKVL